MTAKGLAKAKEVYAKRDLRVRELNAQGKKIMGYVCAYPPLEMVTAMDYVPFKILGSMDEPITKADTQVPTIICPMLRSMLDLGMKGKVDFIEGFIGAHTCDCTEKFCHLYQYNMEFPYYHFLDVPHIAHQASFGFLKSGLELLQKTLEKHTGKKLAPDRIKEEIGKHNALRSLVRELYGLRKQDPPLLSGIENLQIMLALMAMPIEEGSEMVRDIIAEVKARKDGKPVKKAGRLLLWGSPLTETNIVEMIESLNANVVMDDICTGTRHFWPDVEITPDPLDGLAKRYLDDLKCPRTFRETKGSFEEDQEARFGYIAEYAKEWKVNGIILQSVKYCDTHGYEVPAIKAYFDRIGIPAMYLEHEYTMVALAPLKTRVEAFLEMIA
jgi:benzoyl-CoA reductase/2-hydroxyglutaryl-CoA dehydratase subunit BcrC/BadD/HgdB